MKNMIVGSLPPLDFAATESLNTICSNLSFIGKSMKRIFITSCESGDGKSHLTMLIAQNLAGRGKKVAVVDADLRNSAMMTRFKLETKGEMVGLTHYLAGCNSIDEIIYQTNVKGMAIVPIGNHVVNPIPMMTSSEFNDLLEYLTQAFDLVLLDTPPVGLVIDAAEIAQRCDGSILVVNYGRTRRRMMLTVRKQLTQSGCPIIGCILNKVDLDTIGSKYYHRNYYYYGTACGGKQKAAKNRRKKKKKRLFGVF